jgi:hypothetical protein
MGGNLPVAGEVWLARLLTSLGELRKRYDNIHMVEVVVRTAFGLAF